MKRAFLLFAFIALLSLTVSAQTKLLRFPDIHGDKIVFTYAGDLWTASASGGSATRLTAHPGIEVFGKFSPDGKWIAFTGQYDGDEQVYIIPVTGGEPRQLTYYPANGPLTPRWGYDQQVYGWTKDGKSILFRSHRDSWTLGITHLYTVPVAGGPAEMLPMPESGAGDYSPDGTKVVYSPRFRDFRPEKRYAGGQANDLYTFDLSTYAVNKIAGDPHADRDPMWIGNTIFYTSDRDGHFNIYAYDTATAKTAQVTTNKQWDVRWPSSDNEGKIVYELNGELQVMDVKSRKATPISINVPDDALWKRPTRINVAGNIENFELSPKGERALFCARGDIFTAPIEKGPTRNLTQSSGAHDKFPRWSPDGSQIAFISDMSGEEQVYVIAQDGSSAPVQLTRDHKAMLYQPEWSADGKRLAYSDKDGKIYVLNIADKKVTQIADETNGQVQDYTWSPRGNHLAFSISDTNGFNVVSIWSANDGKVHPVTDKLYNSTSPAWDPSGNYIYYLSTREFAPLISTAEFNFATNRNVGIFVTTLRKDVKHPFPAESDEVTITKEDAPKEAAPKPPTDLTIDYDGIVGRSARVNVAPNNYFGLSANKGHLIYFIGTPFYYGRNGGEVQPSLRIYSLKDQRETTLAEPAGGAAVSGDGTKILVPAGPQFFLYDANPQGDRTRKPVSTAGLMYDRNPTEEWNEIFNEVWRRYRDWFYVPNMHGYDWAALREQYRPWLKYVAHRSDLNYLLSEMQSELTIQHAYIAGGDFNVPPRPRVGLMGARFALDKASGKYKITKIFGGQNEENIYRSPLTEVGVNVNVGDYILEIDGEELKPNEDPYKLLRNKADNPVRLTVNSKPSMDGSRTVTYRPITEEGNLVYLDWITMNRKKVEQMSGGRIGYIHIPDMGANGIREFIKYYYPQLDKEGLVVDVRANGGGNVSRMLIERLRRKLLGINYSRTTDDGNPYPDGTFLGPMAAILDANSSSDGDIFPYMFREAGLGPLIGKRSWGGVVGISGRGPLIDGGQVSVPESGLANQKGEWVIEGYGVDPDIEVDNEPKDVIAGKDAQLERAVAEVMAKLKGKSFKLPPHAPAPVKTPK